ncbi:MAG: cytochrome C [Gammaproteobacteria bacterium]|nr:MAG: cytochrome C [Gammaproteobacteria bacterium]
MAPLGFASSGVELKSVDFDIQDNDSLYRGAKLYVQNCLACHSGKYMRYERIGEDLELTEQEVRDNLMINTDKLLDTMKSFVSTEVTTEFFGVEPPDLTLHARYRGSDWIYSYLEGFYEDESRPMGYNNHVLPGVNMPFVMASLKETMSAEDYDNALVDLTNYMTYMAEPIRPYRERMGKWVLLFLFVILIPVWMLKNVYWKNIH